METVHYQSNLYILPDLILKDNFLRSAGILVNNIWLIR